MLWLVGKNHGVHSAQISCSSSNDVCGSAVGGIAKNCVDILVFNCFIVLQDFHVVTPPL